MINVAQLTYGCKGLLYGSSANVRETCPSSTTAPHTCPTVPLFRETSIKAKVSDEDNGPAYKASNSGDVQKPGKDNRSIVDDSKIYQWG